MEPPPTSRRYEGPSERLHALIETSLALGESRDLGTLLRRILDLATRHVGAERGALFVRQPKTGELVATIFHGDEVQQIRLARGKGIAGRVAESGRAVRVADAYAEPGFDASVDERTGFRTRSMLVVPMQLRSGEVVGVVELLNKVEGDVFDEDDEAFLRAFGAQAAVALETARLTEERIRGERLEAVGTVAASLVHDLKSPLSGVYGYTDLILQGPPPDLLQRCVEGIRRQTKRMNHMVASILRFVRGEEPLLFSKIDMDALLDEIVADLRAAHHRRDIEIVRAGERVGAVRADPMALSRLVENLARNAVQAMEAGGTLRVEARLDGEDVRIEIADTGKGMDEGELAALFEPFRTAGKADGTGLGLGIVARVAHGHGGRVDVRSEPGAGTTFVVTLPLRGPAEAD